MSNLRAKSRPIPGSRVRDFREQADMSLDELADALRKAGCKRPSAAKLSRIERGINPVAIDILGGLAKVTGLAPRELRPDLAEKLDAVA